jgi:hypothetical protein
MIAAAATALYILKGLNEKVFLVLHPVLILIQLTGGKLLPSLVVPPPYPPIKGSSRK